MSAGKLRHWLTFETKFTELDSDGASVETWVNAFGTSPRMPCEVAPLSGRELIAAQAVQSRVSVRLKARYRPGFAANMRARATDGTCYNIEAVIPDPMSGIRWVNLLASTGVNAGG